MTRSFRLGKIIFVILYYELDQLALSGLKNCRIRALIWLLTLGRKSKLPRGECLRLTLEQFGPIFVKPGQMPSTRYDPLLLDVAGELAEPQDRMPPFDPKVAAAIVEKSLGKPPSALFHHFDHHPAASALIIQVHFAMLRGGPYDSREVAIKVLYPGILFMIDSDLALMQDLTTWIEKLWVDTERLKPHEVVAEFDKYLHDEPDLMREATNASQLRRNFAKSDLLLVPEVFWDWCTSEISVMERVHGMRTPHTEELRVAGVDMHRLVCDGVGIFFIQVFRDGFFHAGMRPGNILMSVTPEALGRYITLDFGIIGALLEFDKNYLAQDFLAFFQRDYHRVAALYIESGWASEGTRVEEPGGVIHTRYKPYFDRPLGEISLSLVLMRLLQTSRRLSVEVQPQLVLLQRTLLNVEGLGCQLDPDLDLWKTAKLSLERRMHEQIGWCDFVERLKAKAPQQANKLSDFPYPVRQILDRHSHENGNTQTTAFTALPAKQKRTGRLLSAALLFVGSFAVDIVATHMLAWMTCY